MNEYFGELSKQFYETAGQEPMEWYEILDVIKVTADKYNKKRNEVTHRLLMGEWVDTEDIKYLGIDFILGCKIFELSRTVEWNKQPLNGQCITTRFRIPRVRL